jgi:DNA-binding beta-propeller fold protein YncE
MVRPFDVAVAPDGRIAVADPDARSVHLFDTERSRYRRIVRAGEGYFASPVGVTFGKEGSFYVADSASGAVHQYDLKGRWHRLFAGRPELQRPTDLAFDGDRDLLYVVDTGAHRILVFDVEGERVRVIGERGTEAGEFNYPVALAIGPDGRLFVSDAMNFRVQILDPFGSPLGSFGRAGMNPGDLDKSKGIAVDTDGHVYLADALHDVVQVFDDSGRLLTVVGGSGTGPGQFWLPTGIHIDSENRIHVADSANGRVQILRYLGESESGGGS